ncbi:MAG TPA: UDP-N-acetylmuramoylalanyl-D-glutamyl-2, 6-diaminopimelate--D-alanyl-D-alanine ligase [Saprospirales bacterium]|nr:UDP-N-acetylmuramoylalanyl-D-glutamyl-2, 6-diaminopimelate--D-alanyl-D-alanine ligase [Saprospirales bacterium]
MNTTALYSIFLDHPVVSTDTRNLPAGCMFFALKGANFDANTFAEAALANGAAYVVVDNPKYRLNDRCLLVDDVLKALQDLANYHRRQFDIPVIAIGGSNGKTTTKELVSSVLSAHYSCHYTKGNFNNHIGVPLTLLSMPGSTEVAIIEMGTNQPGDIAALCRIAQPTHGLLTNIGKEHLEGFGSLAGVKKAEGELFDYLAKNHGCAFVNLSEKYLDAMSKKVPMRVGYYQIKELRPEPGTIEVQMLAEMPRVKVAFLSDDGPKIDITTQLFGKHNFQNIMTAIALGVYFKVPAHKIKEALEAYTPRNNRSQILDHHGATVLLDAYNANPSSMRPALQSLMGMPARRHIAILGDMLELGVDSDKEHQDLLKYAAKLKVDQIVLVGKEFAKTSYAKYQALHFPDNQAAKTWLDTQDIQDTAILVKGSRGIRLEVVVG